MRKSARRPREDERHQDDQGWRAARTRVKGFSLLESTSTHFSHSRPLIIDLKERSCYLFASRPFAPRVALMRKSPILLTASLLILLVCLAPARAQNATFTGRVTDQST